MMTETHAWPRRVLAREPLARDVRHAKTQALRKSERSARIHDNRGIPVYTHLANLGSQTKPEDGFGQGQTQGHTQTEALEQLIALLSTELREECGNILMQHSQRWMPLLLQDTPNLGHALRLATLLFIPSIERREQVIREGFIEAYTSVISVSANVPLALKMWALANLVHTPSIAEDELSIHRFDRLLPEIAVGLLSDDEDVQRDTCRAMYYMGACTDLRVLDKLVEWIGSVYSEVSVLAVYSLAHFCAADASHTNGAFVLRRGALDRLGEVLQSFAAVDFIRAGIQLIASVCTSREHIDWILAHPVTSALHGLVKSAVSMGRYLFLVNEWKRLEAEVERVGSVEQKMRFANYN
jgi:hypothetical protein